MKKSKTTAKEAEKNLIKVQEDLNKILNLIDSLEEIDEEYDVKEFEGKIDNMQKEMGERYNDLLSKNNLDTKK